MPLDAAWGAFLIVEDRLGGYGSFENTEDGSVFVCQASMDGAYRLAMSVLGEWAEVSILANGERYLVRSWRFDERGWAFFVNDAGEHQACDEITVNLYDDPIDGVRLDVILAGLTVSSWSERDAFARIEYEILPI